MTEEISTVEDDREFEDAFAELTDESNEEVNEVEEDTNEDQSEDPDEEPDESEEPQSSWDSVPEQLRNEYAQMRSKNEELEHSLKSNTGRVSALQKKINELEQATNAKPSEEQREDVDERFNELKEDYPEFIEMIEMMTEKNNQRINQQLDEKLTPFQQAEQQRYNESQVNTLANEYPDWNEQEQSAEFGTWLTSQPEAVQQLISSPQAQDHAYLLRGYNQTRTNKVASITERREKRLASSEALPNKGPSKKALAPDDFEAAFNYYVNKG